MAENTFWGLRSRATSWSIAIFTSWYSSSIFFLSKAAKRLNCMSKMAWAWMSESLKFFIKFNLAVSASRDFLMVLITASKWSRAIFRPSRMWALNLAALRLNWLRRIKTSWRCFKYSKRICLRFRSCGVSSTKATMLAGKLVCSSVCLKRLFKTALGLASLFNSIAIWRPVLSDSSRMSLMPFNFLFLTRSAILAMSLALLTW